MAKKNDIDNQQPMMVSSHDIHLDTDYAEWIAEVKHRYRSAQVKAAVKVNAEKLLWNWQMGRDLVQKKAEERWGAGVVEQVSLDLQKEFPNVDGFSASNLWPMKQWFLFYTSEPEKLAQGVRELQSRDNQDDTKLARGVREIVQRPVEDFPLPFALVPWGQHIEIITKSKNMAGDFVIPARGNSIGCDSIVTDNVATCTQTTICSRDIHNINNKF